MDTKKISIVLILIITVLPISSYAYIDATDVSRQLFIPTNTNSLDLYNSLIQTLIVKGHFPSVSACIIKNSEIVWSEGFGFADIEKNIEATDSTIYGICSITKTITGTALLQLYDQGLFDLDDDVSDYLPFLLLNHHFPDKPITFRMLLSHCSSLRDIQAYWNIDFYFSGGPPFEDYPSPWIKEYVLVDGDLYNPGIWDESSGPGELNVYANINFDIVGYIVEILSGERFDEYCENHIFLMVNILFTPSPSSASTTHHHLMADKKNHDYSTG